MLEHTYTAASLSKFPLIFDIMFNTHDTSKYAITDLHIHHVITFEHKGLASMKILPVVGSCASKVDGEMHTDVVAGTL